MTAVTRTKGSSRPSKGASSGKHKVTEALNSRGARNRALQLISKHAGIYWADAQRTKWLIDLVIKVEVDYRQQITTNAAKAAALEERCSAQAQELAAVREQLAATQAQLVATEEQRLSAQQAQTELAGLKAALAAAEEAAQAATAECASLQRAVHGVATGDSASRRTLAVRAWELKENWLRSKSVIKAQRHTVQQQAVLLGQLKRDKEVAEAEASEATRRKQALLQEKMTQLQAELAILREKQLIPGGTHTHRRAAARKSEGAAPAAAHGAAGPQGTAMPQGQPARPSPVAVAGRAALPAGGSKRPSTAVAGHRPRTSEAAPLASKGAAELPARPKSAKSSVSAVPPHCV